MDRETLDERIDRVAQAMTSPHVDLPIAWRVRSRMDAAGTGLRRPVVGLVALTAVALFAVAVLRVGESPAPTPTRADVAARALHIPGMLREGVRAATPERIARQVSERAVVAPETSMTVEAITARQSSDIEASASVAPLAIAELQVPELEGPDLVEIAPLDISAINVPELLSILSTKE